MAVTDPTAHPAGMGVKITHKITLCEDRTCPAVWATDDPEFFAVQGTLLSAADIPEDVPDHERVVLVPKSVLLAGMAAAG